MYLLACYIQVRVTVGDSGGSLLLCLCDFRPEITVMVDWA